MSGMISAGPELGGVHALEHARSGPATGRRRPGRRPARSVCISVLTGSETTRLRSDSTSAEAADVLDVHVRALDERHDRVVGVRPGPWPARRPRAAGRRSRRRAAAGSAWWRRASSAGRAAPRAAAGRCPWPSPSARPSSAEQLVGVGADVAGAGSVGEHQDADGADAGAQPDREQLAEGDRRTPCRGAAARARARRPARATAGRCPPARAPRRGHGAGRGGWSAARRARRAGRWSRAWRTRAPRRGGRRRRSRSRTARGPSRRSRGAQRSGSGRCAGCGAAAGGRGGPDGRRHGRSH